MPRIDMVTKKPLLETQRQQGYFRAGEGNRTPGLRFTESLWLSIAVRRCQRISADTPDL
jgi:hypothetical protein